MCGSGSHLQAAGEGGSHMLLLLLLMLPWVASDLTVGVFSPGNATTAASALVNVSGLQLRLFTDTVPFIHAVSTGAVDLVYCTPTLNNCFLSEYNLQPVAGRITNGSTVISGDILVNRASSVQSLADLRGSRLVCGLPYITAIFQIQAAAFNQSNFFAFFSVIRYESNQSLILQALARGDFDVAFFRSDQINDYWTGDFRQQFRLVDERPITGSSFTSSTQAYPEWMVLAQPTIEREAVTRAYEELTMFSFGLPYSYRVYEMLLRSLNLVAPNSTCLVTTETDIYPYITCPSGSIKLTSDRIAQNCAAFRKQCNGAFCTCSPCFRPDTTLAFGLQPVAFWLVGLGVAAAGCALAWTVQVFQTGENIVPRVPAESIMDSGEGTFIVGGAHHIPVSLMEVKTSSYWSKSAVWQRIADSCRVSHPNVVKVHGVTRMRGRAWVVHAPFALSIGDARCDATSLLRMVREAATGLQRLHTDQDRIVHRCSSRSVVVDSRGHAQLFLPCFDQRPTVTHADDVQAFGAMAMELVGDAGYPVGVLQQCLHSDPRMRPTITQVQVYLSSVEQQVQASYRQLLNSLLPPVIADRLSQGRQVDFELHDSVAIIFTDIVGFTTLCSSLHPADVGRLLVRLYAAFDRLAVDFGIHKQEIVGDCWVGVTNLVNDQAGDYATRMAAFARELVASAGETPVAPETDDRRVVVRVGIHVGTVVAGVVGVTVPKYCVFGAPINIAARMESTSLPGKIHLSASAAAAITRQSPELAGCITARETPIDVKGLGVMQTYWFN